MYNLSDIEFKMEPADQDDGVEDLITSEFSVLLNGTENTHQPWLLSDQQHSFDQSRSSSPVVYVEATSSKDWQEEVIDFSLMLARQMQATLGRIKNDFLQRAKKFDTDFRDHFFYIANNRLMESFDSFLIGLPKELKSEDCSINRCGATKAMKRPSVELSGSESMDVLAKRHRPSDYSATESTAPSTMTSQSNQSTSSLKMATNMKPVLDPVYSVQKIISKLPKRPVPPSSGDITFETANLSKGNRISATKEAPQVARSIPLSDISIKPKDRTENARNLNSLLHLYLTENKLSSPNQERRMTQIPKVHLASNALNKPIAEIGLGTKPKQEQRTHRIEKVAPKQVYQRRKTVVGKELSSDKTATEQAITRQKPSEQLNMTLTAARGRSRSVYRGPVTYQCDNCYYSSNVSTNFRRHLLIHSGERPFKCEHCDKGFIQKVNYLGHLKKHHPEVQLDPSY